MRLFETNEKLNEAMDSPTPRNNEVKMCKMHKPMMGLTTVRARERVCTYGIPVAIGLRRHERRGRWAQGCDASPADDAICHGTPKGRCVVGGCWEACPSWVPVSLLALHRYGRWLGSKLIH